MIIIGIDPDSKAHGVAVYINKELVLMESMPLPQLSMMINVYLGDGFDIEAHIEDVCAVSAAFTGRDKARGSQAVRMKMAQHIGMCKQAQTEVVRMLEFMDVKVVKHKISKRWKDAKCNEFKLATGWTGRSNEDTRSAAYFGYLGL